MKKKNRENIIVSNKNPRILREWLIIVSNFVVRLDLRKCVTGILERIPVIFFRLDYNQIILNSLKVLTISYIFIKIYLRQFFFLPYL